MRTQIIYSSITAPWFSTYKWFNTYKPLIDHCSVTEHRTKTKDHYKFSFDVPDFRKRDLNIKVENKSLVVEGEHASRKGIFKNKNHKYKSFSKHIWLSNDMDTNRIKANLKNGKLHIYIPIKKEHIKYREIPVLGTNTEAYKAEPSSKKAVGFINRIKTIFKISA